MTLINQSTGLSIDRIQYEKQKAKRQINLINQVQYEIQKEIMQNT